VGARADSDSDQPAHRRAIIIGLDGTAGAVFYDRVMKQKRAPNFEKLMETGVYAPCEDPKHDPKCARAQSGHRTGDKYQWLTGPGWGSVLTGVDNTKTKLTDNEDNDLAVFASSSKEHPTIMMQMISHGMKTAAGGVANFMTSNNHGVIDHGIIDYECGADAKFAPAVSYGDTSSCNLTARQASDGTDPARDEKLTRFLEQQIANPKIDLVMGVYDQIDATGHESGFSNNKKYLSSITTVDAQVGRLMQAIQTASKDRNEQWLIVVTADHGGHNILGIIPKGTHGKVDKLDDAIPFAMKTVGPGAPALYPLSYPVTHLDVHPTIMSWFGLPMTAGLDGHVQGLKNGAVQAPDMGSGQATPSAETAQ
jgi:hypothetical protein